MSWLNKLFGNEEKKQDKKPEIPFEIKVTTSFSSSSSTYEKETFDEIVQDKEGYWILNPGAPFILTLLTKEKEVAKQIRQILDDNENSYSSKDDKIIALFAGKNLKLKEVEEYKDKYKKQYFESLEKQKQESKEWAISGERDKDDMLIEFKLKAISGIYEKANCDLEILFENEPTDITIDDELINEYGFENVRNYMRYADNMNKVRIAPNDSYSRPFFEKLVELDLAIRGNEISKEEILTSMTLKELNAIAENPEKEFKRKNQAIEFVLTLSNLEEKMGKYVSLRELFKLKALPEKYSSLNLQEISNTWSYHEQEVRLLMETFQNSYYSWRDLKDDKYVVSYKIKPNDSYNPCPMANDLSLKTFSKKNPPKMPCHIGCTCFLDREFNYD
jgi:hypothetical protein